MKILFLLLLSFSSFPIDKGFFSNEILWPTKNLTACFENPSSDNLMEREWVQMAITRTWQENSGINFKYWGHCQNRPFSHIRIKISDSQALTYGLGRKLHNQRNGMILNFTFQNWSKHCLENEATRQTCIESMAIHEFGHALGLAHENNRKDKPEDCQVPVQGDMGNETVGDFDKDSIMNYCYKAAFNNKLSEGDIKTIQKIYGPPKL